MIAHIQKYLPRWEGEHKPFIFTEEVYPNTKAGWFAVVIVEDESPFGKVEKIIAGQRGATEEQALNRLHESLYHSNGLPPYAEPLWSSGD